ncbi:unnamed protein product [Peronospora destructor]|uniref:Uncharacterized protein n=1 Tax=Peronospora destructor TaxID=86335 RepID=A0AAV0T7Z9_9STRA|nr:unnamed protein product [Peronospora destructor]
MKWKISSRARPRRQALDMTASATTSTVASLQSWSRSSMPRSSSAGCIGECLPCGKLAPFASFHKKGDPMKPENWRPICLLPTIYKLYSGLLAQKGFRAFNGCHEHNFLATTMLDQT